MFKRFPDSFRRHGISLVEVIFSIGVILIGLLGVMSILPLAGRRAQDAVNLSVGAAMGDAVANEIMSKHWVQRDKLRVRWRGTLTASVPMASPPLVGVNRPYPLVVPREPFCIDPMWVRDSVPDRTVGSYDTAFFPYFQPGHSPDRNPAAPLNASSALADAPNLLPASLRRMVRVGVLRDTMATLLSDAEAFGLVERSDDLRIDLPKDRSLPAMIKGSQANSGGLSYGGRFANGEYSWIATVVPEPTVGYATLSVVTLRNRLRSDDIPETVGEEDPQRNAQSERLTWIPPELAAYAYSGFIGGAGGMVKIRGSLNTTSRVEVGGWVMMSGFLPINHSYQPYATPIYRPIHRWYRVSSADAEPAIDHAAGTWTRTLQLDGPDWTFGFGMTFVTLVEGAVSVTNKTVRIDAL